MSIAHTCKHRADVCAVCTHVRKGSMYLSSSEQRHAAIGTCVRSGEMRTPLDPNSRRPSKATEKTGVIVRAHYRPCRGNSTSSLFFGPHREAGLTAATCAAARARRTRLLPPRGCCSFSLLLLQGKLISSVCQIMSRLSHTRGMYTPVSTVHGVHGVLQTQDDEEPRLRRLRHSCIAAGGRRGRGLARGATTHSCAGAVDVGGAAFRRLGICPGGGNG